MSNDIRFKVIFDVGRSWIGDKRYNIFLKKAQVDYKTYMVKSVWDSLAQILMVFRKKTGGIDLLKSQLLINMGFPQQQI